jgi:hypothetical protein
MKKLFSVLKENMQLHVCYFFVKQICNHVIIFSTATVIKEKNESTYFFNLPNNSWCDR